VILRAHIAFEPSAPSRVKGDRRATSLASLPREKSAYFRAVFALRAMREIKCRMSAIKQKSDAQWRQLPTDLSQQSRRKMIRNGCDLQ